MAQPRLGAMLRRGDRRSIGKADEAAALVLRRPSRLPELAAGLWHPDPLVRMRAGDALEKVSRERPEWLRPLRRELLALAATTAEQELRWHLAQLLPRLGLSASQRGTLVAVLRGYARDSSVIVRVSAMQALVELAVIDQGLRPLARRQFRRTLEAGTPAERARACKLLAGVVQTPTCSAVPEGNSDGADRKARGSRPPAAAARAAARGPQEDRFRKAPRC